MPRWRLTADVADLSLVWIDVTTEGTARLLTWNVANAPDGACYGICPRPAPQCSRPIKTATAASTGTIAGVETSVDESPPEVIAVIQDAAVHVGRPPRLCDLFEYRNYGTVLAVLFSKPMSQTGIDDPEHYVLDNGLTAGSVQIQPGGRVALLNLQSSVGTIRPRTLTVSDVTDPGGNALVTATFPVQAVFSEGVALVGKVVRGDGTPAAGVPVTLTMIDQVQWAFQCSSFTVHVSQVLTDDEGDFDFDFVLAGIPIRSPPPIRRD